MELLSLSISQQMGNLFPIENQINWQTIACCLAFLQPFTIITGGPGTGKTTTVSKFLALWLEHFPESKIMLAAPTGKAAARMKESQINVKDNFKRANISIPEDILNHIANIPANTIHSLLGYIHDSIHFRHNEENPLDLDVLIIDECSMIDLSLFKKLMMAIDTQRTKVILLGDKNQLSAVEAGSILGDLCACIPSINAFSKELREFLSKQLSLNDEQLPESTSHHILENCIVELKKSYRFNDDEGIGKFSKAILMGDIPALQKFRNNEDERIQIYPHDTSLLDKFIQQFLDKENGYFYEEDILRALKKINHAKILCGVKNGKMGVHDVNKRIEDYFAEIGIIQSDKTFYENKLIMVTQNQPELGIYNGDIGLIRLVQNDLGESKMTACFYKDENHFLKIIPSNILSWDTAYSMTIHKSQGSEFNHVLIILPEHDSPILSKELIYTAVTRAKETAILMTSADILESASLKSIQRISGIQERFLED